MNEAGEIGALHRGRCGNEGWVDLASLRVLYLRRVVGTAFLSAGMESATAAGKWIARQAYDLPVPAAGRILANLEAVYGPELGEADRGRLARACFEHIAAFWVEALFLHRRLRTGAWRRFVEIPRVDLLEALGRSDRPAIFVSTYFGNFPIGLFAIAQSCGPVHVVIEQQRHPMLRAWQDEVYRLAGLRFLDMSEAVGRLPEILEAGGKVMLIGEHTRRGGRRPVVRFLNQPHACHPTIAILSQRHDAAVVAFANRRLPGEAFRFQLDLADAIDPRDFGDDDATLKITQAYMSVLERFVFSDPAQYLWTRSWVKN